MVTSKASKHTVNRTGADQKHPKGITPPLHVTSGSILGNRTLNKERR